MYRYKKTVNNVKKAFMNIILFLSIGGIGACFYKIYSDIDVNNTEPVIEVQRISQEIEQEQEQEVKEKSISTVVEEVIPTVVGISKIKDSGSSIFLKDSVTKLGLGTGVIISGNGYIITNQHVVGNKYSTCYITMENGKSYNGNVVWSDADLDLAIVKINARGLAYIQLGDSDELHITDNVYAIGNPIGVEFQRTVTSGIISGLNRTIKIEEDDKLSYMEDLIQTDATINPGNSGGPLINQKGEMIAINSVKITSAEGIGFAIPVNIIKPIIQKFIEDGKFDESYIGIFAYDKNVIPYLDVNLNIERGIYVAQISTNGPSSKSDLNIGDIITKIDNQDINSMSELRKFIYQKNPNDTVNLSILRNGTEKEIQITLGSR